MADKTFEDQILDELLSGKKPSITPDLPSETTGEIEDVSTTRDVAAGLGSGIARGVVGLPGVPGSLEELLKAGGYSAQKQLSSLPEAEKAKLRGLEILGSPVGAMVDRPPQKPTQMLPTVQDVISATAGILPEAAKPALTYKPKTATGRIAQTAGEFTGGALFPGLGSSSALRQVPWWTGLGAVTGAAEEVLPGYGTGVGTIGTLGLAYLQGRRGRASRLLRATEAGGAEARALQEAGRQVGVPLTAAETIRDPRLARFTEEAARQPQAAERMRPFVEARAEQVPAAIERGLLEVGAPVEAPLGVSRQAAKTASAAIKEAEGVRSAAVTNLYERAKTQSVTASDIQGIVAKADELKVNRSPAVQKEIDDYTAQLFDKDGNPITNLGALDDIYKTSRDASYISVTEKADAAKKSASGVVSKLNEELKTVTSKASDDLRAARKIFEAESEKLAAKVGDTGVQSIAKAGTNPNAVVSAISGPKARAETIKSVADQLNKQDKTVFPKVARYWFEEASSQAIRGEPARGGYRFEKAVRGTPLKKKNFDAVIAGVARAKGKNEERVVKAANKLMDVLEATKGTKGLLEPTGAITPPGAKFGEIIGMIKSRFERASDAKFYNQFVDALLSDDSIAAMERLARTNATRDQYAAFLNTIIQPTREVSGGLLAGPQE